jgi:hypothetical protein
MTQTVGHFHKIDIVESYQSDVSPCVNAGPVIGIDRNESTATAFSVEKASHCTGSTVSSPFSLRPCLVTFVTIYMRSKFRCPRHQSLNSSGNFPGHLLRACSAFPESRREELGKRSLLLVNEHCPATSNAESGNAEQALLILNGWEPRPRMIDLGYAWLAATACV